MRLMKWMAFYGHCFENIKYFDFMTSVLTCLNETSEWKLLRSSKRQTIFNSTDSKHRIIPKQDSPKSLRTQNQVQNDTQTKKKQKFMKKKRKIRS